MLSRRRLLQAAPAGLLSGCTAGHMTGSQQSVRGQIESDLQAWDAIELHRTGTLGDHATSKWLQETIRTLGVDVQLEQIPFQVRTPINPQVSDGQQTVVGLPMFDGRSTGPGGVTGRCGPVGSDVQIAIMSYSPNAGSPANKTLNEIRQQHRHEAIVAYAEVGPDSMPGLAVVNAEQYAHPYGPPVLQVPTSAKPWLQQAAQERRTLTVIAHLQDRSEPVSNVLAKVPGPQPELAPLVIMTPRSGWWTCTSERGGGITLWLNALRHFALHPPSREVIFTANTGHELAHVGLDHYLDAHPGLVRDAHAWIHLGANFAASGGSVLWQASDQIWLEQGTDALAQLQVESVNTMPVGQRPYGEARNIFDGGGRYISLLGSNPWFHHPDDRWPDTIDMDKLVTLNEMMLSFAVRLAAR